jgi:large conductance mechanosensitive channel
MFKEFKEFAMKGNIIDLAVGVIIGGAFQKIINSLVNDIIMPLIATFTGKVDFSELTLTIGQSSIKYGEFITAVVNFLIIAFSIFLFIRYINKLNKKLEKIKKEEIEKLKKKGKFGKRKADRDTIPTPAPTTKKCPYCFTEININATRCPHCTSELTEEKQMQEN